MRSVPFPGCSPSTKSTAGGGGCRDGAMAEHPLAAVSEYFDEAVPTHAATIPAAMEPVAPGPRGNNSLEEKHHHAQKRLESGKADGAGSEPVSDAYSNSPVNGKAGLAQHGAESVPVDSMTSHVVSAHDTTCTRFRTSGGSEAKGAAGSTTNDCAKQSTLVDDKSAYFVEHARAGTRLLVVPEAVSEAEGRACASTAPILADNPSKPNSDVQLFTRARSPGAQSRANIPPIAGTVTNTAESLPSFQENDRSGPSNHCAIPSSEERMSAESPASTTTSAVASILSSSIAEVRPREAQHDAPKTDELNLACQSLGEEKRQTRSAKKHDNTGASHQSYQPAAGMSLNKGRRTSAQDAAEQGKDETCWCESEDEALQELRCRRGTVRGNSLRSSRELVSESRAESHRGYR